MQGVNLLPHDCRIARSKRVRMQRWGVGVLIYTAALSAGWLGLHLASGGAEHAVAAQRTQIDAQIADTESAIQRLQPRLSESLATLAAGRSVGYQPNWAILLHLMANLLGDDAVLTRCHLQPAKQTQTRHHIARVYTLNLHGLAKSHETVSAYVLALESKPVFKSVKLNATRREPWGSETAIAFDLTATLEGGNGE